MMVETIDKSLQQRIETLGQFVGNTPLFPIQNLWNSTKVQVYAKLEWQQMGASVKSRPAYHIIRQAVLSGRLHSGMRLLDASSGNTGIAYAAIGAALGIPVTICLPDNASKERKMLLKAYGAEVIPTSQFGSTDEAQEIALGLHQQYPGRYFYANQYGNDSNWQAHYHTTGPEVIKQTNGRVTNFVAGLGTTGTLTGTGRRLREHNPQIALTALHPDAALHGLEGWKHLETATVPTIYDQTVPTHHLDIDTMEAYDMVKEIARAEGLFVSPSSAANLVGALRVAGTLQDGVVVTVFPDNADKYSDAIDQLYL